MELTDFFSIPDDGPQVGSQVYWNDPDGGICSDGATVIEIKGDIYCLETHGGSYVEAYAHELA